ncbi:hypothetical protein Nepgr_009412 [Nepenthes gracilis]|uniref:PRLI-interacting factor A n=1 Tax=Nepenthes gracilis TaxID=150966 RepID=A0AAD3XK48_NEPGR|nr:hypothetical protein Nepgr_009412 [Nepenthes gracilis]
MNDQSQLLNQHHVMSHTQLMNQSPSINQPQMLNQSLMLNQPQIANQPQIVHQPNQQQMVHQMNQSQIVSQSTMVTRPPPMVNQPKIAGQNYGNWPQPPNMPPISALKFPNPMMQVYAATKTGRSNWNGRKGMDKRKYMRRNDMAVVGGACGDAVGGSGYKPPILHELEQQNRLNARRFCPKKRYNRMAPSAHAPRNTTSYIIRAKKSGGIASLVSPCPVTPAVLPTPVFSPSRESLVEMAKEEWGVDGYGSMKGFIRLRTSPGHEPEVEDYEEEEEGGSSESDVEEHVGVVRRLDHDLRRFEMIYPNSGADYNLVLENRVNDQDTHIAQLEEENLVLKERVYLMERELGDLRRRLQFLERQTQIVEDINEEVVENAPNYESEGPRKGHLVGQKRDEEVDDVPREEDPDSMVTKKIMMDPMALKQEVLDHCESFGETDVDGEEDRRDLELVYSGRVLDVKLDDIDEAHQDEHTNTKVLRMGVGVQQGSGIEWKGNKDFEFESENIVVEAVEGEDKK